MKKTVLIADDDRDIVRVLSLGLRAKGFDILIAFDVMQAMMAVRKSPPDAILLDINMPGGGGLEALKNLKSSTTAALIPVIVITANADPELRKTAIELGASAFFNKPFDLEEVHRTLVEVTQRPHPPPGQ